MSLTIAEWFGYDVDFHSDACRQARRNAQCPFIGGACTKTFNDKSASGVCSVLIGRYPGSPIPICPNRLYAGDYAILGEVAGQAFGAGCEVITPAVFHTARHDGRRVVALGKGYGGEIRLPARGGRGAYFVDWILARISPQKELAEFAAVEVQTIDTTGTYRPEVGALREGKGKPLGPSRAGSTGKT